MEFLQQINIEQVADIGLGLLVAGICIKTLFTDKNAMKKQREIWKVELSELESSLRTLISDATDASQIFDKNIRHRQKELTSLLDRTEKTIREAKTYEEEKTYTSTRSHEEFISGNNSDETNREDPPWTKNNTVYNGLATEIEKETTTSRNHARMSLKYKSLAPQKKETLVSNDAALALKNQIEIEKQEQEKLDNEIFQQTSFVDPVAFRIAKRLLLEGKELHVVARKLEFPVSEIRHLDSLLREQAQKDNVRLPKILEEKEIKAVRGIVRGPGERTHIKAEISSAPEAIEPIQIAHTPVVTNSVVKTETDVANEKPQLF